MAHLAVSIVGADRPGIVAAVTKVLFDEGCNLDDTSSTILRGHFAMMLVVASPGDVDADRLERALAGATADYDLLVTVNALDASPEPAPRPLDMWTLSIYGADRPGIVHRVTTLLADAGINVVDLTTRVIGQAGQPVYVMMVELDLPAGLDPDPLQRDLRELCAGLDVECSLNPADPSVL